MTPRFAFTVAETEQLISLYDAQAKLYFAMCAIPSTRLDVLRFVNDAHKYLAGQAESMLKGN